MDVDKLLKSTHFKASTIIDYTTPYLLKQNMKYFLTIITDLVNAYIKHSNFPLSLKYSIITPILKNNSLDMTFTKHYRPISNLPFLSKLLESAIAEHINNHILKYNLDNPSQGAYKNITLQKPYYITCLILLTIGLKIMTMPYYTLNHHMLYRKLKLTGLHDTTIDLIQSYLTNMKFSLKNDPTDTIYNCLEIDVP